MSYLMRQSQLIQPTDIESQAKCKFLFTFSNIGYMFSTRFLKQNLKFINFIYIRNMFLYVFTFQFHP